MSLPVSSVVNVNISVAPTAPASPGFGIAALVSDEPALSGDVPEVRIQFFSSIAEVAEVYDVSSVTYAVLNTYFGQAPRPETAAVISQYSSGLPGILRGGAPVDDTLASWQAILDGSFTISIDSTPDDITALDFSAVTSMDDVAAAIQTRLQASLVPAFAGTLVAWDAATSRFIIETGAIGQAISFTSDNVTGTQISDLMLTGQTDGGTATDGITGETVVDALTAAESASAEWYGVLILPKWNDTQTAEDVAAWVQSRIKWFNTVTNNPNTLLLGNTDNIGYRINQAQLTRTMVIYSSKPSEYPDAAAFGEAFTTDFSAPQSVKTLKFKIFELITPENINSTQKNAMDAIRVNASVVIGAGSMFAESYMASQLFADELHSIDWLTGEIESNLFNYLSTRLTKVPLTDAGAASLEQQVIKSLDAGVFNGMLGAGTTSDGVFLGNGYAVTVQRVADMDPTDKANRIAPTISFIALLSGAVHFVEVRGTVER